MTDEADEGTLDPGPRALPELSWDCSGRRASITRSTISNPFSPESKPKAMPSEIIAPYISYTTEYSSTILHQVAK